MKSILIVLAVIAALAAFTVAGWTGFRATTVRVAPDQPSPSAEHPSSGCVWCHIVDR